MVTKPEILQWIIANEVTKPEVVADRLGIPYWKAAAILLELLVEGVVVFDE